MKRYRDVPQGALLPMRALAALTDGEFKSLALALQEVPPGCGPGRLRSSLDDLEGDADFHAIVSATLALAGAADRRREQASRTAERVSKAPNLELTEGSANELAVRLEQLLGTPSVLAAAKFMSLQLENQTLYSTGRVISDLRPIFLGHEVDSPSGFIVMHALRIDTFGDGVGGSSTVEFQLDRNDLLELKRELERALKKHDALSRYVEGTGLACYRDQGEDEGDS